MQALGSHGCPPAHSVQPAKQKACWVATAKRADIRLQPSLNSAAFFRSDFV